MKLASVRSNGETRVGLVVSNGIVEIQRRLPEAPSSMSTLIERWPDFEAKLRGLADSTPDTDLAEAELLAPLSPGKILAIGLNYMDHRVETRHEKQTEQVWFAKAVTSINSPFGPIELPAVSERLDHECELVAVIGKRCRNVPRERAGEVVFGYCVGNDVSVRDWQLNTSQWTLGKSFDTHAPIGPWITTADEIDAQSLDIRCLVNGEVRQSSNTRHMIFDVAAQIEHLTKVMTLEPGDLLFTGTCAGVGSARKPPLWLCDGDTVRVEIEGLGAIENRVQRASGETVIG